MFVFVHLKSFSVLNTLVYTVLVKENNLSFNYKVKLLIAFNLLKT